MERIKIKKLFAEKDCFSGKEITVCGWARSIRDMKNFGFLSLNDGSCFSCLQVVLEAETLENYAEAAKQNTGADFIVTGTVLLTPDAQQPL